MNNDIDFIMLQVDATVLESCVTEIICIANKILSTWAFFYNFLFFLTFGGNFR